MIKLGIFLILHIKPFGHFILKLYLNMQVYNILKKKKIFSRHTFFCTIY